MGQRDERKKRDSKCERDFINLVGFEDGRKPGGKEGSDIQKLVKARKRILP